MKTTTTIQVLKLSFYCAMAFLVLLTTLHVLKPDYDPTWRLISEYEIGEYGWVMRMAFFCWGLAFVSLSLGTWSMLQAFSGFMGKWGLLVLGIAVIGAGFFAPLPITTTIRTTTDRIHGACGGILIFTFPLLAPFASYAITKQLSDQRSKLIICAVTLLVWIGIAVFFSALIKYSPEAKTRNYSAATLIGLPNRFMVFTYTVWLLLCSYILKKALQTKVNQSI